MALWFTGTTREGRKRATVIAAVATLAALRLCHSGVLWSDEDYHLSAAMFMLFGKMPYRDFWYDKPPLNAFYYLLIGAHPGVVVRLLDTGTVLIACYFVYQIARTLWSSLEGYIAAFLLAFYWAFYLPAAVIPFAADAIMVVPHAAAIYFAVCRRPLLSGFCAGLAFLTNNKGIFVLVSCSVWVASQAVLLFVGFVLPLFLFWTVAAVGGAWAGYVEQVWGWSFLYARKTPSSHPLAVGLRATADWIGFQAGAVIPACYALLRDKPNRFRVAAWLALSFAAVCLGGRFAPRYFLQLLPPVVVLGARGIALARERWGQRALAAVLLLLITPAVRFGPRYAALAYDLAIGQQPAWSDVQMDLDSQRAAREVRMLAKKGDTLFVWGYRPDIYVYSRLGPDGLFDDSQPLTGVPADRHLTVSQSIDPQGAAMNRCRFITTHPTFFVDGIGRLNPSLKPEDFPEIREWLKQYQLVGETALTLIYMRR